MIGNTLSHYKIVEKLGAGGQGEVYLAEDSRLDRKVALKILPQHLADRADLRERFEREARAVSSLNHPHICTLYDIGEQDGIHYLVMEHLEGETLAARLEKGALPLEQTLQYAIQIADALDKAHRQGVVHRDLKPGNIMLTKSGAKLLDFGLAKLQATETPTNLSALPTEQASLTAEGTILGTLQYMAPEQLEGKEADSRTDIFAFGAVVYEMATGKKAFEGGSQASLISAIMKDDPPPMSELQPMTPLTLDHVVRRCMSKAPEDRWQAASDVMAELRWVAETGTQVAMSSQATPNRPSWRLMAGAVVLTAIIAGVGLWSVMRTSIPTQGPSKRFVIDLPFTGRDTRLGLALSPDGQNLVYLGTQDGTNRLYRKAMDQLEALPIPGTEGASKLFFSPDGQWVGFFSGGNLRMAPLLGGPTVTLAEISGIGASWGEDDNIVISQRSSGLLQVPATGGTPEQITIIDTEQGETAHYWGTLLPGGKAILYTAWSGSRDTMRIGLWSVEKEERQILFDGTNPLYVSTGHIVFAESESLWAVPFDVEKLEVTGSPVLVLGNLQINASGYSPFTIASDGTLVYIRPVLTEAELVWVDRQGQTTPVTEAKRGFESPRFSPDGEYLAVTIDNRYRETDVWLYEMARGTLSPLTFGGSSAWPTWTLDGNEVTFESYERGIFTVPADGSGEPSQLINSGRTSSWSPDGAMAYEDSGNIYVLAGEREGQAEPFLVSGFGEDHPMFSPDGKWIAFTSNPSGQVEVYVKPYPGEGRIIPISTDGGDQPVWAADGKELFYRNGDKMMLVSVQTEPSFQAGTPKLLFEGSFANSWGNNISNYDVAPDGQQFVMVKETEDQEVGQIHVVLNWFEELKRLVPTDN